jgi:hypothetical protein
MVQAGIGTEEKEVISLLSAPGSSHCYCGSYPQFGQDRPWRARSHPPTEFLVIAFQKILDLHLGHRILKHSHAEPATAKTIPPNINMIPVVGSLGRQGPNSGMKVRSPPMSVTITPVLSVES